jgi:hypothetical protein
VQCWRCELAPEALETLLLIFHRGLAIEAMVTILTPRFISFFLTLWIVGRLLRVSLGIFSLLVTANVSSAFWPIPMLPGVFKYSYAMPFYNLSRAVLTICFNTRNQSTYSQPSFDIQSNEFIVGLDFGVQVAWIAVSSCTIVLFQWFVVKRAKRGLARSPPAGAGVLEKEAV